MGGRAVASFGLGLARHRGCKRCLRNSFSIQSFTKKESLGNVSDLVGTFERKEQNNF